MAKTFDDKKIIYTMDRVTRSYGTKVVLKTNKNLCVKRNSL